MADTNCDACVRKAEMIFTQQRLVRPLLQAVDWLKSEDEGEVDHEAALGSLFSAAARFEHEDGHTLDREQWSAVGVTAPEVGVLVIAAGYRGGDDRPCFDVVRRESENWWVCANTGKSLWFTMTHWMPVPPMPLRADSKEGGGA